MASKIKKMLGPETRSRLNKTIRRNRRIKMERDEISRLSDENRRFQLQAERDRNTIERLQRMAKDREDRRKFSEAINRNHRMTQTAAQVSAEMVTSQFGLCFDNEAIVERAWSIARMIEEKIQSLPGE